MMKIHNISNSEIQLFLNYGPLGWFASCLPLSWLLDRHGSRVSVLLSIWLVFFSSVVRMFATDSSSLSLCCLHASFILNAMAGPIAMSACSKISEDWFPPSSRTTATAIMGQASIGCGIIMWLMVPLIVTVEDLEHYVRFNYVCLGGASVTLAMALFHFPNYPINSPSSSAGFLKSQSSFITASSLWESVTKLLAIRDFVIVFSVYSLLSGYAAFIEVLLPNMLLPVGFDQSSAAWVGFIADSVGCVIAIMTARFADSCCHPRRILIGVFVVALASASFFSTIVQKLFPIEPNSNVGFFWVSASFAVANIGASAAGPLMYEMAVEFSFGTAPEGSTLMLMNTGVNVITSISLFLPTDQLGTTWMPWAMVGTLVASILCVSYVSSKQNRIEFDRTHQDFEQVTDSW
jgi:FLVCR family MFS transporter